MTATRRCFEGLLTLISSLLLLSVLIAAPTFLSCFIEIKSPDRWNGPDGGQPFGHWTVEVHSPAEALERWNSRI